MKKSTYALCGSALIGLAAILRAVTAGGPELLMLIGIGLILLAASADTPKGAH